MAALQNPPSLLTYGALRFLIVDSPSDLNIEAYVKEFKANNVTDVVRACEPSYNVDRLEKAGVRVHVRILHPKPHLFVDIFTSGVRFSPFRTVSPLLLRLCVGLRRFTPPLTLAPFPMAGRAFPILLANHAHFYPI